MNPASKEFIEFKEDWVKYHHGQYSTLESEEEFLNVEKQSERIVLYYLCSSINDSIVDKHLKVLAQKHLETKFCKVQVEKTGVLREHLKITEVPCIILCKGRQVVDYITSLGELKDDDFSLKMLEWKMGKAGLIKFDGDLTAPHKAPAVRPKYSKFTCVEPRIDAEAENSDEQGDH